MKLGKRGIRYERYIYFARRVDTGLIKIGATVSADWRLRTLRHTIKADVELLAETRHCATGLAHEKRVHDYFAAERVEGEWFRPSDRLMRAISYVQRFGNLHHAILPRRPAETNPCRSDEAA